MSEPKAGPALIKFVLRNAGKPLTTRQLQEEVHRRVPFCLSDSIVALNIMRLNGSIKVKRGDSGWIWWIEEENKP
jgi:hypothetical protein